MCSGDLAGPFQSPTRSLETHAIFNTPVSISRRPCILRHRSVELRHHLCAGADRGMCRACTRARIFVRRIALVLPCACRRREECSPKHTGDRRGIASAGLPAVFDHRAGYARRSPVVETLIRAAQRRPAHRTVGRTPTHAGTRVRSRDFASAASFVIASREADVVRKSVPDDVSLSWHGVDAEDPGMLAAPRVSIDASQNAWPAPSCRGPRVVWLPGRSCRRQMIRAYLAIVRRDRGDVGLHYWPLFLEGHGREQAGCLLIAACSRAPSGGPRSGDRAAQRDRTLWRTAAS